MQATVENEESKPAGSLAGFAVSRPELRWAMAAAAAIVALSCFPYLFGWWLRPGDFMGHVYNADDPAVHLAWMRQAAEGRWLFVDRFTSEPQQPQFFHLFFLVLGRIAGLFGGSYAALITVYHLARVVIGWLLLVSGYLCAAYQYPQLAIRRVALLVAGLSSGLGWWLNWLRGPGAYSCDFAEGLIMPEAITFLSLYIFPLFVAGMLLIVWFYLLLLRAFDTGSVRLALGAGAAGLVLGQIHTYDILPLYAVVAVYVVAIAAQRRAVPVREMKMAAIAVATSLPAPVYQYLVFQTNPIFRDKALTQTLSPGVGQYALTFGLVLAAACVGVDALARRENRRGWFLVVWALVTVAMAYAPVSFQRKMIEGAHIPLAILAAAGLVALAGERTRVQAVLVGLFLLLTIPSNLAVMAESQRRLMDNNSKGISSFLPPYYLDRDERGALDWLAAHAGRQDIVLSTPIVGAYMPPYCGVLTYVSHWAETADLPRKLNELRGFLQGFTSHEWRIGFLRDQRIRYVYFGMAERSLGSTEGTTGPFDPSRASYLHPVYQSKEVTLYEVRLP